MLTIEQQTQVLPKLKTILLIHAALGMGLLTFMIAFGSFTDWQKLSNEASILGLMGAVTGLMIYGLSFIFPKLLSASPTSIAAQLLKQNQTTDIPEEKMIESLVNNAMSTRIIVGAMLEAGILLNLIVFFLEPSTVSIFLIVIGLLLFAFRTPFLGRQLTRLEADLDNVNRELKLLRMQV